MSLRGSKGFSVFQRLKGWKISVLCFFSNISIEVFRQKSYVFRRVPFQSRGLNQTTRTVPPPLNWIRLSRPELNWVNDQPYYTKVSLKISNLWPENNHNNINKREKKERLPWCGLAYPWSFMPSLLEEFLLFQHYLSPGGVKVFFFGGGGRGITWFSGGERIKTVT